VRARKRLPRNSLGSLRNLLLAGTFHRDNLKRAIFNVIVMRGLNNRRDSLDGLLAINLTHGIPFLICFGFYIYNLNCWFSDGVIIVVVKKFSSPFLLSFAAFKSRLKQHVLTPPPRPWSIFNEAPCVESTARTTSVPLQQFHMQSRQGLCKLASGSGIGSTEQIANHRTDRAIKKYA